MGFGHSACGDERKRLRGVVPIVLKGDRDGNFI